MLGETCRKGADNTIHTHTIIRQNHSSLRWTRVKRLPSIQSLVKCERMRLICFELAFMVLVHQIRIQTHTHREKDRETSNWQCGLIMHCATFGESVHVSIGGFLFRNFGYISYETDGLCSNNDDAFDA